MCLHSPSEYKGLWEHSPRESNKTNFKGVLSRFIVDSYRGDNTLGTRLIEFDQKL